MRPGRVEGGGGPVRAGEGVNQPICDSKLYIHYLIYVCTMLIIQCTNCYVHWRTYISIIQDTDASEFHNFAQPEGFFNLRLRGGRTRVHCATCIT